MHTGRPQSHHSQLQREKLLSVAGHLFWQKGYLGTSIDEIANVAKVNKAIIYYYFKNKAALLYELSKRTMQSLLDQVVSVVNSDMQPERKLQVFITNHLMYTLTHLGLSGIGQLERKNLPARLRRSYTNMRNQYEMIFRKIIEEGKEQGKFRPIDTKVASLFILGLLNSIVYWFRPEERLSPEQIASETYIFIFNALNYQMNLNTLTSMSLIKRESEAKNK